MKSPNNIEPIPSYGDLMTVQDMSECIAMGAFIDYDGFGNYATSEGMSDIEFKPSTFDPPEWASHVVWFNK